ncbi:uroporphyrinogen-III synthase [Acetobacter sp. TBRC 12305]|uniref:Uroporphyrinogen-III synthase n=1 Tax=Acetobacter garciniae TaxID=2817435 RepID=A0A939HI26_9PROT|nr:uroporphyrinogen-III synthase [Acetobacter garciniae]MBO1323807.1 uroporphyrinogen-III synthase [Acetobacter garciniae]MBX0343496.1 uroporphyrinogen-III synthase [Acetobacter garciniae]
MPRPTKPGRPSGGQTGRQPQASPRPRQPGPNAPSPRTPSPDRTPVLHGGQAAQNPVLGVLVTRPEPGLSETIAAVAAAGWQPYASPALVVRPRLLPPLPCPPCAVVLTSGQAVPCAAACLPLETPLFAVGARTAARARQAGFSQVHSADGDATALATLVMRQRTPADGALLLLCGAAQGQDLASQLRKAGFRVLRRIAYEARPAQSVGPQAEQALEQADVAAVLFFSALSAKSWLAALPPGQVRSTALAARAVVISANVATVLHAAGWAGPVAVASHPDAPSMIAALGRVAPCA